MMMLVRSLQILAGIEQGIPVEDEPKALLRIGERRWRFAANDRWRLAD
jgi:hypothetical protein